MSHFLFPQSYFLFTQGHILFPQGHFLYTQGHFLLTQGHFLFTQGHFRFQLSGSIMVVNVIQFVLAATGVIGVFVSYVSPLTVTAYLCTVVTSLAGLCVDVSKPCWGVALL